MREVLKKQRARQRSKRMRLIVYVSVFCAVLLVIYHFTDQRHSRNWQVEVLSLDEQEISDALQANIIKTAKEYLANGSRLHLQDCVDTLQDNYSLAMVNLIKTKHNSVVIYVEARYPRMRVMVGEDYRLISSKGEVYGYWEAQQLPELVGVLATNKRYPMTVRNSLELNQQEQQSIASALAVLELGKDYRPSMIVWEKYRGFKLKTNSMSVFLGFAPYEKKFAKLKSIVSTAQKKNIDLAKIELDYHGKAFVKQLKEQ